MDWSRALGPPMPLSYFLEHLESLPRDAWLLIPRVADDIRFDTPCRPRLVSTRDLSEDEANDLDNYFDTAGLKYFFLRDQLEDIVDNLRQQDPAFSEHNLLTAINYYWHHDAFVVLSAERA